jgi:hypothetical protein
VRLNRPIGIDAFHGGCHWVGKNEDRAALLGKRSGGLDVYPHCFRRFFRTRYAV